MFKRVDRYIPGIYIHGQYHQKNVKSNIREKAIITLIILLSCFKMVAQISPGDLSNSHSNLSGISNCTQCHVLGNKITNQKCLNCHTEILTRINLQKGYHSSPEVKGKGCFECHSEHNGKNFLLIHLDTAKFDHRLTGFSLSAAHSKTGCKNCHSGKYIENQKLKARKNTYLGVKPNCINCHADVHKGTLSSDCLSCHDADAFKQVSKFNHTTARFQLKGRHENVACVKCHKIELIDGIRYQEFRGLTFGNCTSCHKDPHSNKYGQNCRQCHSEESFLIIQGTNKFDHNKTDYKLEGKHLLVNCKACHKGKFTDPLKFDRCTSCHTDYHNSQFVKSGVAPDCSQCHTAMGFASFSFTIEQHNSGSFQLKGAHVATPCLECHKKQERWSFRNIGLDCKECHSDIHKTFIQSKYYPQENCKICHLETRWNEVKFDHSLTRFDLTGAHAIQKCRDCHFKQDDKGVVHQRFTNLPVSCTSCHIDRHFNQFEKEGITECSRCHDTENWKALKFDHNKTAFKLDGKHIDVPCAKCHKPQKEGSNVYIKYKLTDFKCESCHYSSSIL